MSLAATTPSLASAPTLDWPAIGEQLDRQAYAIHDGLLTADDCESLTARYDQEARFRSRVVMARHNFGRGEYKYFSTAVRLTERCWL